MTLAEMLISVWKQILADGTGVIELGDETYRITMFRAKRLRSVEFNYGAHRLVGIEQNPAKGSRWALLAQEGKRIMQFRCEGRYVANACEGKLICYSAWQTLELPE